MRRVRNKRLKRNIVEYMKQEKMINRLGQKLIQQWGCKLLSWRRNARTRMFVKAYAFQIRRRNDSRK